MTALTWNHDCSVGVSEMDHQHGVLMDAMNELRMSAAHGAAHSETEKLLNQLIEFARMHFRSEERLMEQYGFPGLGEHRAEHSRLLARLLSQAGDAQRGKPIAARSTFNFLREWFMQHIRDFDRQYGLWLNEHGVS